MLTFDERDLLTAAELAAFSEIPVHLVIAVRPAEPRKWEYFYRAAPNPLAPALEEALHRTLTPTEIERYVDHVRPLVESGAGTSRRAAAFVSAVKDT